jgi:hypothetical protein
LYLMAREYGWAIAQRLSSRAEATKLGGCDIVDMDKMDFDSLPIPKKHRWADGGMFIREEGYAGRSDQLYYVMHTGPNMGMLHKIESVSGELLPVVPWYVLDMQKRSVSWVFENYRNGDFGAR